MFENLDWDIDEDYLKDFKTNEKEKISQLSFKKSIESREKLATNNLQFELNCNNFEMTKNKINSQISNVTYQKNANLHVLKNANNKDIKFIQTNTSHFGNLFNSRFNMINEYNKNSSFKVSCKNETNKTIKNIFNLKPVKSTVESLTFSQCTLKNINKQKRKKNVAFLESMNNINIAKKKCVHTTNQSYEHSNQYLDFEKKEQVSYMEESSFNRNNLNDSKKLMLLDLLKFSVQRNVMTPKIKQTVTRKFPGPAGLIPDNIDEIKIVGLDEYDKDRFYKFNDMCSQNTKKLFSEGAWQIMMDDLPANFELLDIGTVKETAIEFSRMFKKVPYLAGIVQYIDHKPNDPHIILKDLSGRIDAYIHHTICNIYPNALGTNTVILVKDAGLVLTSKKHIYLIISIKNLVSIYSDDGRLVETSILKQLLNNNHNYDLHESQISIFDETENF